MHSGEDKTDLECKYEMFMYTLEMSNPGIRMPRKDMETFTDVRFLCFCGILSNRILLLPTTLSYIHRTPTVLNSIANENDRAP